MMYQIYQTTTHNSSWVEIRIRVPISIRQLSFHYSQSELVLVYLLGVEIKNKRYDIHDDDPRIVIFLNMYGLTLFVCFYNIWRSVGRLVGRKRQRSLGRQPPAVEHANGRGVAVARRDRRLGTARAQLRCRLGAPSSASCSCSSTSWSPRGERMNRQHWKEGTSLTIVRKRLLPQIPCTHGTTSGWGPCVMWKLPCLWGPSWRRRQALPGICLYPWVTARNYDRPGAIFQWESLPRILQPSYGDRRTTKHLWGEFFL